MEEQKCVQGAEKQAGACQYVFVVLAGVFAGFCLLFGMILAMQISLKPIHEDIRALTQAQVKAEAGMQNVLTKVTALEAALKSIKKQGNAPAPSGPQEPQEDFSKVYDLPVGSSYILGDPKAPVTIVEFSDMQCPYCGRFHPALKDVVKAYPGKVKVMFKHFPLGFHQMARPAAKAAMAAGVQGKFYEMIDLLMANNTSLSAEKFNELAKQLGLNEVQFAKDLKERDAEWEKVIAEDMALAQTAAVMGTPTYFLNGKRTNARTLDGWKQEIDALLKK
jgi:protein-disulfide isomerase